MLLHCSWISEIYSRSIKCCCTAVEYLKYTVDLLNAAAVHWVEYLKYTVDLLSAAALQLNIWNIQTIYMLLHCNWIPDINRHLVKCCCAADNVLGPLLSGYGNLESTSHCFLWAVITHRWLFVIQNWYCHQFGVKHLPQPMLIYF